MWQFLLLAAFGTATADEQEIPRQHHLYRPGSNGPEVLEYGGEPTLHCSPDMFPPGLPHTLQSLPIHLFSKSFDKHR